MPAATDTLSPIGSIVSICKEKPASHTAAGYAAIASNLIEIGEVDQIGEYGAESSVQSRTRLKDGIVKKRKGPRNMGAMPLTLALVPGDEGQQALDEGERDSESWTVQVKFPDGTVDWMPGFIMSWKTNIGGAEAGTIMASANIEIDDRPIRVYPT